jgi:hypothetical protein
VTAPFRPYAGLSLAELIAVARGSAMPAAILTPAKPDDTLRQAATAAGIAITHNATEPNQ